MQFDKPEAVLDQMISKTDQKTREATQTNERNRRCSMNTSWCYAAAVTTESAKHRSTSATTAQLQYKRSTCGHWWCELCKPPLRGDGRDLDIQNYSGIQLKVRISSDSCWKVKGSVILWTLDDHLRTKSERNTSPLEEGTSCSTTRGILCTCHTVTKSANAAGSF